MELEEAKERCKKIITTKYNNDYSIDSTDKEAIETVLKEQEDLEVKNKGRIIGKYGDITLEELLKDKFVSKDVIKERIEEINNEKLNYSENEYYLELEIKGYAIDKLQELLKE